MTSNLFENEYYTLSINEDRTAYLVTNRQTGVVEHSGDQLPGAYHVLYHLTVALQKRPWEWITAESDMEDEEDRLYGLTFGIVGEDDAPTH